MKLTIEVKGLTDASEGQRIVEAAVNEFETVKGDSDDKKRLYFRFGDEEPQMTFQMAESTPFTRYLSNTKPEGVK